MSHDAEIHILRKSVRTKDDLIAFLHVLRQDLGDHNDQWENPTLERFLESLAAWLEDMDLRQYYNRPDMPEDYIEWRFVADMMCAAKIYE